MVHEQVLPLTDHSPMAPSWIPPAMIGSSSATKELRSKINLITGSDAAVLITGESGTGKEVVARLLHSKRHDGPFVAVNCAALPKDIIENELFGHERGAFTGALPKHVGCFELAHGGTLFLDEVVEMHQQTQAKLLRAIETQSFRRLGGKEEISVSARIVAATNKRTDTAITSGELRQDLFYRLSVFEITLLPLRDRRDDIPELLQYFVSRFCEKYERSPLRFSASAMASLVAYDWPGNVREVKNFAERTALVAAGEEVDVRHLPEKISRETGTLSQTITIPVGTSIRRIEETVIRKTLISVNNNKSQAARILGLSRKTLYEKLNSFRIRKVCPSHDG
jgi:DNA-binding NtrC family response regulator